MEEARDRKGYAVERRGRSKEEKEEERESRQGLMLSIASMIIANTC